MGVAVQCIYFIWIVDVDARRTDGMGCIHSETVGVVRDRRRHRIRYEATVRNQEYDVRTRADFEHRNDFNRITAVGVFVRTTQKTVREVRPGLPPLLFGFIIRRGVFWFGT